MAKEGNTGKSLLAAGAATAVAGVTLYAVGKVLSFLFRDVDPERIKHREEEQIESAEEQQASVEDIINE